MDNLGGTIGTKLNVSRTNADDDKVSQVENDAALVGGNQRIKATNVLEMRRTAVSDFLTRRVGKTDVARKGQKINSFWPARRRSATGDHNFTTVDRRRPRKKIPLFPLCCMNSSIVVEKRKKLSHLKFWYT